MLLISSVIKNVAHLCERSKSKTWGHNGWQKVVVCVVSDGRNKVNKRTLHVLSLVCSFSFSWECLLTIISDGLLPRRYCQGLSCWKGCNCAYFRVRFHSNKDWSWGLILFKKGTLRIWLLPTLAKFRPDHVLYRSYSAWKSKIRRNSIVIVGSLMPSVP